jgi:hypothetical protein
VNSFDELSMHRNLEFLLQARARGKTVVGDQGQRTRRRSSSDECEVRSECGAGGASNGLAGRGGTRVVR